MHERRLKRWTEASEARDGWLASRKAELPKRKEEILRCQEAVATLEADTKTRERELATSASAQEAERERLLAAAQAALDEQMSHPKNLTMILLSKIWLEINFSEL